VYFNNYLVKLELAKRAWQQADLAREARLSEPTVRAVLRGRRVSAATALKVVQALERIPPNERLVALLNWSPRSTHGVAPTPSESGPMVTSRLLIPSG
jgi:transcriptional regulator with XRE-family HTH domain